VPTPRSRIERDGGGERPTGSGQEPPTPIRWPVLAVFLCARSLRATERGHEYHQVLHDFVEQIEQLLTVLLLVLFGWAVARGLAYATSQAAFPAADEVWAAAGLVVIVSVVARGGAAGPIMNRLDRRRRTDLAVDP
jgi:NhaP-type Na+/H+ or K+/H+ antiporter